MTTDRSVREVPFEITLNRFTLSRYQGSQSPSSYESDVTIRYKGKERNRKIYMNNIARVGGFRIYQSSYDRDERGTILSVNHDPAGTALTYAGYALLFAGLVASLASRKSRLRTLYRSLGTTVRLLAVAGLLLSAGCSADAGSRTSDDVPDRAIAARFGALPVQSLDGRIEPLGSYASEVLRKLYHGERYRGMNADQVLLGIVTDSARWSREPLIRLDSKPLREALGTNRTHVSFAELFDGVPPDGYRIGKQAEAVYAKAPAERTKLDKEYLKLDEKANILYGLLGGRTLRIFPVPDSDRWLALGERSQNMTATDSARTVELFGRLVRASVSRDTTEIGRALDAVRRYQIEFRPGLHSRRITAELLYNRLSPFRWAMRGYLILGTALLGAALWEIFGKNRRRATRIASIAAAAVAAVFAWQTFGLGLRWYVSGHAPWSNAYETMVYVGWATVLSGLVFARRSRLAPALAALMGGVALFVSNLNWLDPQITPLVPVLKSYWLMIHVSVVTASYGFFGICAACGIASLAATGLRPKSQGAARDQRNGDDRRAGVADRGHFLRRRLGQRVVGPLLGLGPERDMGADHDVRLRAGDPFPAYSPARRSVRVRRAVGRLFLDRADDLFRRKLLLVRTALLRTQRRRFADRSADRGLRRHSADRGGGRPIFQNLEKKMIPA